MRILLYGGCHVQVLQILLDELFEQERVETRHLVNFRLIASGKPFPPELIEWSDALVFSPIEHKQSYNTDLLQAYCEARGVRTLAFPWMEWHGYSPGAVKGDFKGRFQWFYPDLVHRAGAFSTFGAFFDHVVEHFPDDDAIDWFASDSASRLAAAEERLGLAIRISDFVRQHHRASRLFLIADHPSLALYLHVIKQIAGFLDLPFRPLERSTEPQWRWRMPILPRVRERLGLTFSDTEWIDDELIPGQVFDLKTYLSLYYHTDGVILGPNADADIRWPPGPSSHATPVEPNTRIFANPVADETNSDLATYDVLAALSGSQVSFPPKARFAIEPVQWRSTWQF